MPVTTILTAPARRPQSHSRAFARAALAAITLLPLAPASHALAEEAALPATTAASAAAPVPLTGPAPEAATPAATSSADIAPAAELAPAADPAGDATHDAPLAATPLGRGTASYYGAQFNGQRTASGERFDMNGLTAAHRTLPFGSKVRVTNTANGKSVVVRINDRGPFARGRLIDLSRAAAGRIGLIGPGHGTVELALVEG